MSLTSKGKVIIFSAPSGSGKTTVVQHLLKKFPELCFSISATTRKPREGEVNGREYYFLDEADFRKKIEAGSFLEHEEVYKGLLYGTLLSEVQRIWDEGKTVVFDVDVKGGMNIKEKFGANALSVFLKPPGIDVLMERLKKRSSEVEHQMKERIEKAKYELSFEKEYDVVLINDVLEETFVKSEKLVSEFIGGK